MKTPRFALVVCALVLTSSAFGQDDNPLPISPSTPLHTIHAYPYMYRDTDQVPAPVALTIPNYSYSVVSPVDGKTYNGQIVGANPTTRPAHPTVVPTVIVPVRLVFKYSSTVSYIFDPTVTDPGCIGSGRTALGLTEQSPLFNDVTYKLGSTTVGNTQYIDAFQRANFWKDVSATGANYHTLLGITPMPLQTVTIPSANTGTTSGTVYGTSGLCGSNTGNINKANSLGVMSISFWDPMARKIITNLGITPNTFVFFLFYNAVMSSGASDNTNNCCIFGYHDITGSQTYGTGEFEGRDQTLFAGTADTSALSHELGEWVNDPTGVNPTPAWGHLGQVPGCQNNYEVGDPLSGTLMPAVPMPNGFTYHLQELAFFDWYYRVSPSLGVNGWYSLNGAFTNDAGAVCM
jgi:hypothetical protein